jgi:hypothetical protein
MLLPGLSYLFIQYSGWIKTSTPRDCARVYWGFTVPGVDKSLAGQMWR